MANVYQAILTATGEQRLAESIGTRSVLDLAKLGIGDGKGLDIVPNKNMTKLAREVYRGEITSISQDEFNQNLVIIEGIVPNQIGGFTVREVGVFDTDGALLIVANYPATFKPIAASGADKVLVVRLTITFTNPSSIKAVTIFDHKDSTGSSFRGIEVKGAVFQEGFVKLLEGSGITLDTEALTSSITINSTIPDWEPLKVYKPGNIVTFDSGIFKCLAEHDASVNFIDDTLKWASIGGGKLKAEKVQYSNPGYPELPNVQLALDRLLYSAIGTPSVSNNVGSVLEIGSTVQAVNITWSIPLGSKPLASQSMDNGIGIMPLTQRSQQFTNLNLTSARSWNVTVSDGQTSRSGGTGINFQHRRYWGVVAGTSLSDPDILNLSKEFSTSRGKTINPIAPTAQYIYYAYPDSWGACTFTVNGLLNTDWILTQRLFTNASGNTTMFRIYRSGNKLTGSYNLVIQ